VSTTHHVAALAASGISRAQVAADLGQSWGLIGRRPHGIRKGRDKGCYRNAGRVVSDRPRWRYVEDTPAPALVPLLNTPGPSMSTVL
jgi:hypothetical protein